SRHRKFGLARRSAPKCARGRCTIPRATRKRAYIDSRKRNMSAITGPRGKLRIERAANSPMKEIGARIIERHVTSVDRQISRQILKGERRCGKFVHAEAPRTAQIIGHRRCRTEIQKRQHPVDKTLSPPRIEPAVKVGRGYRICRQRELPLPRGIGTIERPAPMRTKRLRSRKRDVPRSRLEIHSKLKPVHRQIQEWRPQRSSVVAR